MPIVILTASERETNLFEGLSVRHRVRAEDHVAGRLDLQIEAASRGESALDPGKLAAKILAEFSRVSSQLDATSSHAAPIRQSAEEVTTAPATGAD